jgi:hypothetical protein
MTDWKETLPEELRAEPMLKDIPDIPTLAKVAVDGRKLVSQVTEKIKAAEEQKAGFEAQILKAQEEAKAKEAAAVEAEAALRKEWGSGFDEKIQAAKAAARAMGFPAAAVDSMPVSQARYFAQAAAKLVGNNHQVGSQGPGAPARMTAAERDIEMAKIRKDPEYFDGRRPDLHNRMAELMAMQTG